MTIETFYRDKLRIKKDEKSKAMKNLCSLKCRKEKSLFISFYLRSSCDIIIEILEANII